MDEIDSSMLLQYPCCPLPPCQFANWKRKNPIKLLDSLKKSMEKLGWFAIKGSRLFFKSRN